MVYIRNPEHFRAALAFARTLPRESRKSLRHCFRTLNRIKRNAMRERGKTVILSLFPDFVGHSWYFQYDTIDGQPWMNGGLILHGFEQTLSVEINPQAGPHWSIHT